jgi:D-alanine--poly(phosphoribitol) ligase subunit 2
MPRVETGSRLPELNAIVLRLEALFRDKFHVDVPTTETDLLETGRLDSMQLVELLLELETNFGFRIPIEEIDFDDLRTLSRIARVVLAHAGDEAGRTAWQPVPEARSGADREDSELEARARDPLRDIAAGAAG